MNLTMTLPFLLLFAMPFAVAMDSTRTEFFKAVKTLDYGALAEFYKKNNYDVNPNVVDERGITAVGNLVDMYHKAPDKQTASSCYVMMEALLKLGADANRYCKDNNAISVPGSMYNVMILPSMILHILELSPNAHSTYDLVVLLLQYGLDKNDLNTPSVRKQFCYEFTISGLPFIGKLDDNYKIWVLLFSKEVQEAFDTCTIRINDKPKKILEECQDAVKIDQGLLDIFINPPKNSIADTLKLLQREARKRYRMVSMHGVLGYIQGREIGHFPKKKKLSASYNADQNKRSSSEVVGLDNETKVKRSKQEE